MTRPTVGILHPGSMGAAVAAQATPNAEAVLWCSAGRSPATRERAEQAGLTAVGGLRELAERCDIVMGICPPANAIEVASAVAETGFTGLYVEANAVAPATVSAIHAEGFGGAADFLDAAVVGSPPSRTKSPRLYVSGAEGPVHRISELFKGTAVDVRPLAGDVGQASALKLAYTSFQKTSRVLAAVSYALAEHHQVHEELLDIASLRTGNYLAEPDYIPKTAARAWRWGPELGEAASALTSAGLPADQAHAAAKVLDCWQEARGRDIDVPEALRYLKQEREQGQ